MLSPPQQNSAPLPVESMATGWDVASVGWAMIVLGWLISPITTSLLPKILSRLGFDASQKLRELEIRIIPELRRTARAVDEERMMQRAKKSKSDVDALDKMAAMLRHAQYDVQDIFDDQHEKIDIIGGDILCGVVQACAARWKSSCAWISRIVRCGSARLLRWPWRSSSSRFVRRASGEAASDEPFPVAIDITASDEPALVAACVAASDQPWDSSGRCLSCLCCSFNSLMKNCCTSIFCWLAHVIGVARAYRDWSYDAVGITSYQDDATMLEFILTAVSRRNLKNRIEKVESIVNEVKASPLMGIASKSAPHDIANKNRSQIRIASKRKVFGREVLRDHIMAKLHETPPTSDTAPCYSVIGIYGVAGSGKTTFARYTRDYIKDECKEKLFHTIMCIHVSETFTVDDIFHEMLKDITRNRHSSISDREELEEKLKESLRGKRFFLILDDLWVKNKNDPQLEELISPLNVGLKGSKILVTARTKDAAGALCANKPIKMPDLDEDIYFSMFMHYALGGTSVVDEEFIRVGKKIAKKLHQSPIAAVTLAGRLGTNLDIGFWKNTAELDMLNDTMDALWWSYQQLNPDIRRCLEYCNIYPRRSILMRDELVHLWIAQGFVKTSCATEDMEDVAEGYIQELVSHSFLQTKGTSCDTGCFTIHDLLHDLLDKVVGCDCFRIENARSQRGECLKGDIPRDVRHLFVLNYDGQLITEKILGLKNLRTLIIYIVERGKPVEQNVIESICKRLPKLRVLAFALREKYEPIEESDKFSVPESISQLKHLRYFAFRTSYYCTVVLPSTLSKLHHIQLLDFAHGINYDFPSTGLIKLRHIFSWPSLEFPNIGRLVSLQRIPAFAFTVKNEQGYEMKQLRDLNKLRGKLEINGLENVKSKEESLEANLGAKERLTELTLSWGNYDDTRCSPEVEAEVVEGLCPPVGLERVRIEYYKGSSYPEWMVGKQNDGPKDLQALSFWRCNQLGPGPELEAFIHLRVLHIFACRWNTLPGNMEHLTSLKKLEITGCMNIRSLPTLPQSLEEFTLAFCDDEFMMYCQTVGHPYWQKIEHISQKVFDPSTLEEGFDEIASQDSHDIASHDSDGIAPLDLEDGEAVTGMSVTKTF